MAVSISGGSVLVDRGPVLWLEGNVSPVDIVRTLGDAPVIRGCCKGKAALHEVAGAVMRLRGDADVYLATWVNWGLNSWLESVGMWMEANAKRSLSIAFRPGAMAKISPKIQKWAVGHWGPRALLESEDHADVCVLVGDGWKCTIRSSQRVGVTYQMEDFDVDMRPQIADMHLAWFARMQPPGSLTLASAGLGAGHLIDTIVSAVRSDKELHAITEGEDFAPMIAAVAREVEATRCSVMGANIHSKSAAQVIAAVPDSRMMMGRHQVRTHVEQAKLLRELLGPDRFFAALHHEKWAVLECPDGFVTLGTSANLNHNHRHEHLIVTRDPVTASGLLGHFNNVVRLGADNDRQDGYYWETYQRSMGGVRRERDTSKSLKELLADWGK